MKLFAFFTSFVGNVAQECLRVRRHWSWVSDHPIRKLVFIFLLAVTSAFGQSGCEFNLSGTWESALPGQSNSALYHFAPNGRVTVFSRSGPDQRAQGSEIARATYKLDDPKAPKAIEFKAIRGGGSFPWGITRMEITKYDGTTFTSVQPGSEPTAWVRIDPQRYFVVLAARQGTPNDGGPALGMLIKTDGSQMQINTFGLYYNDGRKITGPVPAELYNQFMTESRRDSDVMLRLEVTSQEFERSMKIMQSWQRRAREDALLFSPRSYLNSIVPLKEIAESLNQCGEKIKLHKLDWKVDDEIGANYGLSVVAFQYVKKLRELNDPLHVPDDKFQQTMSGRLQGLRK
jgi:hypothetical protein